MTWIKILLAMLLGQMPMGGVTVQPSTTLGNPLFTSYTSLGSPRNNFTGLLGFAFQTPSSSPPTITGLCRFNTAGDTQTHQMYLVINPSGTAVRSAVIDASLGTPGTDQCVAVTPLTLNTSTFYYVGSCETNGGDLWRDVTTGIPDSAYGTVGGYSILNNGACTAAGSGTGGGGNTSYVPVNLTRQ